MEDDVVQNQILQELAQLARGFDVYGNRVPREVQIDAMQKYNAVKQASHAARMEESRVQADIDRVVYETQRAAAEAEKLKAEAHAELARLKLEEERIKIEKATLVVRALEAVARKDDVPADRLLAAASLMGEHLIGQPLPLALEDKGGVPEDAVEVDPKDLEEI